MTPTEMCDSCIHRHYCPAAHKKDHWCGNWTDQRREVARREKWEKADFGSKETTP